MSEQRTIVITGGSDGIGAAAARKLTKAGHRVVIVGRSPQKTEAVAKELGAPFHLADYSDLAQVRELATVLAAEYPRIDVLANNAGGIMGDREVTADGFEKTFQINHLGGFLLTHLLMPKLIESKATLIQTASVAAKIWGHLDIDDLQSERNYAAQKAYGTAKLANILFTRELQNRFGGQGVNAAAFHPGIVASSFATDTTHMMRFLYHSSLLKNLFTITPEKGADTLVWLAQSTPGNDWKPGGFFEKRKPTKTNRQAYDDALAARLWDDSLALLKL